MEGIDINDYVRIQKPGDKNHERLAQVQSFCIKKTSSIAPEMSDNASSREKYLAVVQFFKTDNTHPKKRYYLNNLYNLTKAISGKDKDNHYYMFRHIDKYLFLAVLKKLFQ